MNEHRRKGESQGPRLSPGERAKHWAQAAVTAWPIMLPLLGVLGYTNADHITGWTGLAQPDARTEITETDVTFEQQVQRFSQEVNAELSTLRKADAANLKQLEARLETLSKEVAEIQELVN